MGKRVRIYMRHQTEKILALRAKILEWGQKRGVEVTEEGVGDLVVSLGGDGTFLEALSTFRQRAPVLSVKLGRFGFLAETTPESLLNVLETWLERGLEVEEVQLIEVDSPKREFAANEVVFMSGTVGKTAEFLVDICSASVQLVCDGFGFATPFGTTAYALAAGASIVHPDVPSVTAFALNPHTLSWRPVVLPSEGFSASICSTNREVIVLADGRKIGTIPPGVKVGVRTSEEKALRAVVKRESFLRKLSEKFCWGKDARR